MSPAPTSIIRQIGKGLLLGGAMTALVGAATLYKPTTAPEHAVAGPQQRPEAATPLPPPSNHVSGLAQVMETNRLSVAGTTIALVGLEKVNRPEAIRAAQAYLDQVGAVSCRPAGTQWTCRIIAKDFDVAEIFTLSGFATTGADAPAALRDAEAMARQARRGVWGLND